MKLMLYNLKKLFKLHWWQDEELVDQLAEIIIKLDYHQYELFHLN